MDGGQTLHLLEILPHILCLPIDQHPQLIGVKHLPTLSWAGTKKPLCKSLKLSCHGFVKDKVQVQVNKLCPVNHWRKSLLELCTCLSIILHSHSLMLNCSTVGFKRKRKNTCFLCSPKSLFHLQ